MTTWTASLVAETLGDDVPGDATFGRVWTDSRSLAAGDLFVALVGERFDGHDYLEAARAAGATGAVVRDGTPPVAGLVMFHVPDTLRALGLLAHRRRQDVSGPVVAVTGTNGKTSTKEFLARALGARWTVHATHANLNNEVGVPLTILAAPPDAQALVVEAGASVPGEIARLRDVIAPTVAVVTNVSLGHVEGFGSLETVLAEKVSLTVGVPLAVVGMEPPELAERARAEEVVRAGLAASADVHPDAWELDGSGCPVLTVGSQTVRVPVPGKHLGENAMLALAVAQRLGLDPEAVGSALATATVPGGRCEVLRERDLTVLHDAYNANPASFRAALETATAMRGDRPLVVLAGSMLELGDGSVREHERIAAAIVAAGPVLVGAVGAFGPAFASHRESLGEHLILADDVETLGRLVAERLHGNELVLLKASRGVRLERALPHLLRDREAKCSPTS